MFIYSLNTLSYFVRNLDVTRFLISSVSTGLRTCTNVAQEHLRSEALPYTTVILSFKIPLPYPLMLIMTMAVVFQMLNKNTHLSIPAVETQLDYTLLRPNYVLMM